MNSLHIWIHFLGMKSTKMLCLDAPAHLVHDWYSVKRSLTIRHLLHRLTRTHTNSADNQKSPIDVHLIRDCLGKNKKNTVLYACLPSGKSLSLIGKSTRNGQCSIAMFVYQRVFSISKGTNTMNLLKRSKTFKKNRVDEPIGE